MFELFVCSYNFRKTYSFHVAALKSGLVMMQRSIYYIFSRIWRLMHLKYNTNSPCIKTTILYFNFYLIIHLYRSEVGRHAPTCRACLVATSQRWWTAPGWYWWNDDCSPGCNLHAAWTGTFDGTWCPWCWRFSWGWLCGINCLITSRLTQ